MITSHIYRTDYAGIDPAKQVCTHIYLCGETCGKPHDEHTRFLTPRKDANASPAV